MNHEEEEEVVATSIGVSVDPIPPPKKEPSIDEKKAKLAELVSSGRRALKVNDIDNATQLLSDAAELSVEIYGENHEETFESIFYYGAAMLEQAKTETELLTKQNNSEKVEEEASEKKDLKKDDGSGSEKEDGEESEDDDEDEDDSMKLAWELLETARCIATAKLEQVESENSSEEVIKSWRIKKSDTLTLLGEHSMADGKYVQAQEDLTSLLEHLKSYCSPTSRLVAHAYTLLGKTCGLDLRYEETVSYYEHAKEILQNRIDRLKKRQAEEDLDEKAKEETEVEIRDLEQLLPEVQTMIDEAITSAAQTEEVKQSIKAQYEGFANMVSGLPKGDDAAEANDISSIVRRPKRQNEDIGATDSNKKSKENAE